EFEMLLRRGAVQYVRPDVCMAGGLTHCKKIAALAEAHHVGVVPHNPLSPVSTAACLQLAACIPNFALQEYPLGESEAPKSEIVKSALIFSEGYLTIPDAPGIGIELADAAAERHGHRAAVDGWPEVKRAAQEVRFEQVSARPDPVDLRLVAVNEDVVRDAAGPPAIPPWRADHRDRPLGRIAREVHRHVIEVL